MTKYRVDRVGRVDRILPARTRDRSRNGTALVGAATQAEERSVPSVKYAVDTVVLGSD